MNLKKLKNKKEFFQVTEIWKKRTDKLYVIVVSKNAPPDYRAKARRLFQQMVTRQINMLRPAVNINEKKLRKNILKEKNNNG